MDFDMRKAAGYVEDRIAHGWTATDVVEYRGEVARIRKTGTDDEKLAAMEFWALKETERNNWRQAA